MSAMADPDDPASPVTQTIDGGLVHHRAGRLEEAEAAYGAVLEAAPENAEALHLMGVLAYQRGQLKAAIEWFGRAVALDGENAKYLGNLGTALFAAQRLDEALPCLERAAALDSVTAEVLNSLGEAYRVSGRLIDAVAAYGRAVAASPAYAEAHGNMAVALLQAGRSIEALASAEAAAAAGPENPACFNTLGSVLRAKGRLQDALAAFGRAVELAPDFAPARRNLGLVLIDLNRFEDAAQQYRRVIDEHPQDAAGYAGLARALRRQGRNEQSIALHRKAVGLDPGNAVYHASLLFNLLAEPAIDGQALFDEHRVWNARHAAPLRPAAAVHRNDRDPDRRLRLGYVSGDFRTHPVGRLALPVVAGHDNAQFEVFCYSRWRGADRITTAFQDSVDEWRATAGLDDAAMAEAVRADGIDILVDLAGHTARGRLLAFARKPAPVQIAWLGYLCTTGLDSIDYVIGDPVHTPAGCEDDFSERILRMPYDLACFDPPSHMPEVGALPSAANGRITFGVFNNPGKITAPAASLWARVLDAVPGALLAFKYRSYDDPGTRDSVLSRLTENGIAADRVEFLGGSGYRELLECYRRIDIALDTFPYAGTMTTFEALWMGVPLVTVAGKRMVARAGAAHLSAVGLDALVAGDEDKYIAIARDLADDAAWLGELRGGMRERLRSSPLCDVAGFVRNLEALYREAWRRWCAGSLA